MWDDNADMHAELLQAMYVVGFIKDEQDQLFSILAAVLHLSNVGDLAKDVLRPCPSCPALQVKERKPSVWALSC